MTPLFIVEFRLFQYLLLVLVFGVLQGAVNGDWPALTIFSTGAVLLWWHSLLDAAQQGRKAIYQAGLFDNWVLSRLFR